MRLVEGMGIFFASVILTGFVVDTSSSSFRVLKWLVKMRTKHLLVYQFLESGMLLAPVVGLFFLVVTVVQLPKGFLKLVMMAPSVTTRAT